jgi:anti-sigma factor RsiW
MSSPSEDEKYEALMMKSVDGVLDPKEARLLEEYLEKHPERREELRDFSQIKEVTDMLTKRILDGARFDTPKESAGSRAVVTLGSVLVVLGLIVLVVYGGYALAVDPTISLAVKIGSAVAGIGAFVLLAHVVRLRLGSAPTDPYKEIDR